MSRLRFFLLVLTLEFVVVFSTYSQSTIVSWPLTTNFPSVTFNTAVASASYTKGGGINEYLISSEGGDWWGFTTNSSKDASDYLQIRFAPLTGGSRTNVYVNKIEFNLRQEPWNTGFSLEDGPTKYELHYSKAADFSNSYMISSGDISSTFSSGDITLNTPISVFSGETIYFRLYGYLSGGDGDLIIEKNQFFIKGFTESANTVNPVPALSFVQNCSTDGNLIYDLPGGFNANNRTVLIFAKAGSPIIYGASTALLSSYPNVDNNLTTFNGSAYQHDANAKLVYKGTVAGPQTLIGLSAGVDYYFVAFSFRNSGGSGNISAAIFANGSVNVGIPEVDSYNAATSNTITSLSFIAPSCVDAVMIVAKESSISGIPSGNGSLYIPNSDYTSASSSIFDGGKVVYNTAHTGGSLGNVTVTNLTNDVIYYFKAFVRNGTTWSDGIEIMAKPNMAAIAFTQTQANGSDFFEFITLERQDLSGYNITDQGICESEAIYRSFTEWEEEGFFNISGNPDVTSPLVDVPAGTFVKVYSGNTPIDIGFEDGLISLRNSNLNLSNLGDQVMVYTGSLPGPFADCSVNPNPIKAGTNFADPNDWITSGTPTDNTSFRPGTNAAFATLSNRGRSRYNNNTNLEGDSAAILSGLVNPANWQFQNNTADYWQLKRILFNQSDYLSGTMSFSTISSSSFDLDATSLIYTDASRSTRYMVVVRPNSAPQDPVDRYTCYNVSNDYSITDDVVRNVTINYGNGNPCGTNQTLGNGKVVYFDYDLPSALNISGLLGCTTYQVAVYAVNGNGVTANFGTPVLNQITTSTAGSPTSIYYSQQSGNFSDPIWDNVSIGTPGALPILSPCLKLIIQSGHTVTLDANVSYGGLEIETGATLVMNNFETSLQRDLTINGNFISNTGKFILNGSDGQQILTTASEIEFYDLEIDKASVSFSNELLLAGDAAIAHLVTIVSGDLTVQSGNSLRLISDQADYAAALGPVPNGSVITGNFIVERYLPAVSTDAPPNSGFGVGWRYVGSSVQNSTLSQFVGDAFIVTGVTGAPYANWTSNGYYFPSLQFYDESIAGLQSVGFDGDRVGPAPNVRRKPNVTDPIPTGTGVFWYLGSVPGVFDVEGTPNNGDQIAAVSYTSTSGGIQEDGWNLKANPYPSAIDWKLVNRSTGVGNFAYIYDATGSGNYVVIDALASGPQLIASSNAFWVKTSQAGTLTFEESDKSLDVTAPFYKNADEAFNEIYISILSSSDSSLNDFLRLRFMEEASADYDVLYDAQKKFSLNPIVPGISTMIDTNDFAINSFHPLDSIISIPLKANIRSAGAYQFSFDMAGDYFDGMCLVLHDLLTDEQMIVEQDAIYSFDSETNEISDAPRFELIFSPTTSIETKAVTCFNGTDGELTIHTIGEGPFVYSLFDANDVEISSEIGENDFTLTDLSYGFYTLLVDGLDGNCSSIEREFFIAQPAASEAHTIFSYATECQGDNNGEIQLVFSDSLVYDLQLFSNDLLIDSAMGVSEEYFFPYRYEGIYRVDVLNSCDTLSYQTQVYTSDSMLIDFTLSADTIYIQDGAEVYCENTSMNASTYNWFFSADQEVAITETNAEHVYTEAGTYEIYLLGKSQAGCQHYINKSIVVIDLASSVDAIDSEKGWAQVRYSNNAITFHFGNLASSKTNLQILNELGQVILLDEINSTSGSYEINTQQLQSGIYFIRMQSANGFSEVKRFVVR